VIPWINELTTRLERPAPRRLAPADARQAAVLVPLWVDGGELWTLLVRRAEHLRNHRNQYAFPGGGREIGEDAWTAALREAEEELGLDAKRVLRLGQLDEHEASSGYRVIPCVGALPTPASGEKIAPRPDPAEVADVFALPVRAFVNPSLVEDRDVLIDGKKRQIRIYHLGGRQIWGLTARILQNLVERLMGPHAVS
jgi:8-oxo-dGTP pyrophosphatase MutT (NUDIX family)